MGLIFYQPINSQMNMDQALHRQNSLKYERGYDDTYQKIHYKNNSYDYLNTPKKKWNPLRCCYEDE